MISMCAALSLESGERQCHRLLVPVNIHEAEIRGDQGKQTEWNHLIVVSRQLASHSFQVAQAQVQVSARVEDVPSLQLETTVLHVSRGGHSRHLFFVCYAAWARHHPKNRSKALSYGEARKLTGVP